jgi:sec-independent protein translocase protein TatC
MPLRDHLVEARRRILLSAAGVLLGAVGGWFLFEPTFERLQQPILDVAARRDAAVSINFGGVATALDLRLQVAVFLGILVSSPWWLYQVWAFIAPGLKRREKVYTLAFLGSAIPLFAAGVVVGFYLLPRAVELLTTFVPDHATNLIDAEQYLTFAMRMLVAFALGFVFPVVMVALSWLGIVSTRAWLRGWRWAVLVIFLFAAIATPTSDASSMMVLAVPMTALYFGAIGIGALRRRARREAEE